MNSRKLRNENELRLYNVKTTKSITKRKNKKLERELEPNLNQFVHALDRVWLWCGLNTIKLLSRF